MPPPLLFDLTGINLDQLVITKDQIRQDNPQRYEFEQLDGIIWHDFEKQLILGFRDIQSDEWWARGHIPGRPLFPGVLMIEAAAQLASFLGRRVLAGQRFIGFGGIDKVKFRESVVPPAKMYILAKGVEVRPRRIICDVQGLVNDRLVFGGQITGVPM